MTGTVAAACFVTGLISGWLVRSVFALAEISRSQERMQTKIRYWQSETFHARHRAERFARRLSALEWPFDDASDDSPQDEQ